MYVELPPCLAKVKFELDAMARARALSARLRLAGLSNVRDMLPIDEHRQTLAHAGLNEELLDACKEISGQLKRVSTLMKYGTVRDKRH